MQWRIGIFYRPILPHLIIWKAEEGIDGANANVREICIYYRKV